MAGHGRAGGLRSPRRPGRCRACRRARLRSRRTWARPTASSRSGGSTSRPARWARRSRPTGRRAASASSSPGTWPPSTPRRSRAPSRRSRRCASCSRARASRTASPARTRWCWSCALRETVEVTASLAKPASPKYTEPLRDIPQTITVVPQAMIGEQVATNLRDVLRNVTGISIQAGEGGVPAGDNLSIRGFSARTDVFIDGVRDFGGYSRDPYNVEQVEVAKGPSSAYGGRGSTGGSVNLASKFPTAAAAARRKPRPGIVGVQARDDRPQPAARGRRPRERGLPPERDVHGRRHAGPRRGDEPALGRVALALDRPGHAHALHARPTRTSTRTTCPTTASPGCRPTRTRSSRRTRKAFRRSTSTTSTASPRVTTRTRRPTSRRRGSSATSAAAPTPCARWAATAARCATRSSPRRASSR